MPTKETDKNHTLFFLFVKILFIYMYMSKRERETDQQYDLI